jgi:hypothetical protein
MCRHIHGQRVVVHRHRSQSRSVQIFDFSRAATFAVEGQLSILPASSRIANQWQLPKMNLTEAAEVYSISVYPFFKEDVATYLPYVCITRKLKEDYTEFMVCADDVVGVMVSPSLLPIRIPF